MEVLKVMQKQFFLSPEVFREGVRALCDELDRTPPAAGDKRRPRILITGCPMASGNTKVPELIEARGGIIVAEESCTGTRSFADLVDESKPPMEALAERYLKIPCACMSPNERRVEQVLAMAREYRADGVVHYSLQGCHGYNVERYKVQKALKEARGAHVVHRDGLLGLGRGTDRREGGRVPGDDRMITAGIDAGSATAKAVILVDGKIRGSRIVPAAFDFEKAAE